MAGHRADAHLAALLADVARARRRARRCRRGAPASRAAASSSAAASGRRPAGGRPGRAARAGRARARRSWRARTRTEPGLARSLLSTTRRSRATTPARSPQRTPAGRVLASIAVKRLLMRGVRRDARAAAVVRARRPARVGEGGRGRARGHRARRLRRRVSALRRELGDDLFVRSGRGIALTAGGRRLAALASEILGLAEQARRSVPDGPGPVRRLQVATTDVVGEHIGPLIDAFGARDESLEIAVEAAPGAELRRPARAPPRRHHARPAPGPRAVGDDRQRSVPALPPGPRRCTGPPLAGRRELSPSDARGAALARRTAGRRPVLRRRALPGAQRPRAARHRHLREPRGVDRGRRGRRRHRAHPQPLGARGAARALARGPRRARHADHELWHASTLGLDRALPVALTLQRFATTPEATQAMSAGRVGHDVRARAARGARHVVALRRGVAAASSA